MPFLAIIGLDIPYFSAMQISVTHQRDQYDVLVLPLFEKEVRSGLLAFDPGMEPYISGAIEKDFEGKKLQSMILYGGTMYPRLLLIGLGKKEALSLAVWKRVVGAALIAAQSKKAETVGLVIPETVVKHLGPRRTGQTTVIAVESAAYAFDDYKNEQEKVAQIETVTCLLSLKGTEKRQFGEGVQDGKTIAEAVNDVRRLGNTPPTVMTPSFLAEYATSMCKGNTKLKAKILSRPDMKKLGMGCLLGVSSGSAKEPKFIIIEYHGAGKGQKPIVLTGKGITFDSGGLHIKPDPYMNEMKFDMLGAASVLGIIKAAAALGIKKNLVGLIPACENMPDGDSYRPDDILRAMNGKTVEIINTDAEGRVILADALSYATMKYKPKEVINLATLTGACMVALGLEHSGLFSTDDSLAEKILESAKTSAENLWRLPLGEEFSEQIKSDVADIKNLGDRYGGASSAAAFLQFFTLDPKTGETTYPLAHIDMSSAYVKGKGKPWIRGGANGFGVEALIEYLRS